MVTVTNVERMKDGGTTYIDYELDGKDGKLTFPTPFRPNEPPTNDFPGKYSALLKYAVVDKRAVDEPTEEPTISSEVSIQIHPVYDLVQVNGLKSEEKAVYALVSKDKTYFILVAPKHDTWEKGIQDSHLSESKSGD